MVDQEREALLQQAIARAAAGRSPTGILFEGRQRFGPDFDKEFIRRTTEDPEIRRAVGEGTALRIAAQEAGFGRDVEEFAKISERVATEARQRQIEREQQLAQQQKIEIVQQKNIEDQIAQIRLSREQRIQEKLQEQRELGLLPTRQSAFRVVSAEIESEISSLQKQAAAIEGPTGEVRAVTAEERVTGPASFFTKEKTGSVIKKDITERQRGFRVSTTGEVLEGTFESRVVDVIDGVPQTKVFFVPKVGSETLATPEETREFRQRQQRVVGVTQQGGLAGLIQEIRQERGIIQTRILREGRPTGFAGVAETFSGVGSGAAFSVLGTLEFGKQIVTSPIETAVETKQSIIRLSDDIVSGRAIQQIGSFVASDPGFALGFVGAEVATGFLFGKVMKVPGLIKKGAVGTTRFFSSSVDDIVSGFGPTSRRIRGLTTTIDLDDIARIQREAFSEAVVRVAERRAGILFEPIEREFIKGQIKVKLSPPPRKIPKPTLTFDIDLDDISFKSSVQRARLRTGADVVTITKEGKVKIVEALPEPKKVKPISFDIDIDILKSELSRKVARLKSEADVFTLTPEGKVKIVEALPEPKKVKPISFDIDILKEKIFRERARLKSGADVVEVTKTGQVQIVEAKQIQKQIPKIRIETQTISEIQQKTLQRLKEQELKFRPKVDTKKSIVSLQKVKPVQDLDQALEFGTQQAVSVKFMEQSKLETVQIQEKLPKISQRFVPILKTSTTQKTEQLLKTNTQSIVKQKIGQDFTPEIGQEFRTPQIFSFEFAQPTILSFTQDINQAIKVPQKLIQKTIGKGKKPKPKFRKKPQRLSLKTPKSFTVEIRRRGKFFTIAKTKDLSRALSLGRERVATTLAATFRVRGAGSVGKLPGFRRKGELFIERRGRRLSRIGEVTEIQAAKRRKPKKKKGGQRNNGV